MTSSQEKSDIQKTVLMFSTLASTEGKLYSATPDHVNLVDKRYTASQSIGNSGLSFGAFELDVANNSKAYSLFQSLLQDAFDGGRVSAFERDSFLSRAATKGLVGSQYEFTDTEIEKINTYVLQPGGSKIFAADMGQLSFNAREVQETEDAVYAKWGSLGVLDPANPDYKLAIGHLTSWSNRTGGLDTFKAYLSGQNINQSGIVTLTSAPTIDDINDYLKNQKQFKYPNNPDAFDNVSKGPL